MNKKDLLSIGDFSKITGVHIKALRYYDSIGILPPIYTDPESGYRYYALHQKAIVDAIQFCVELGIPLKEFSNYTDQSVPWISYADLVGQGKTLLEERIRILQGRLARLENMRVEIARSENSYQNDKPAFYTLPARDCWLIPYEGPQLCEESNHLLKQIILEIYRNDLRLGNIGGLLSMRKNGKWTQFLFVDVQAQEQERKKHSQILHIPCGRYLCKRVDHSDLHQAEIWSRPYVDEQQIRLMIETELFVGNYHFTSPVLEQRCLLKTAPSDPEK